MLGRFIVAFAALTILSAQAISAADDGAFAPDGLPTLTPYGWADFCQRYEGECDGGSLPARQIEATAERIALLVRVNKDVNARVRPVSDFDHWGVRDRWDLPTDGQGDCEDYVLLKRKQLVQAGLPRQALLVTIVKDEAGDGHAVLIARTTRGDLILDNMNDQVKLWRAVPYRFVKRQSQENENYWVSIGAPVGPPRVAAR